MFYITLFIVLFISSITDIKKRIIPNSLMIGAFLLGCYLNLIANTREYIFISIIVFVMLLFSPLKSGGDIKLLAICTLYLRQASGIFFMILGLVMLVLAIYKKSKNEKIKSLPLAPYISIASLITLMQTLI